MSKQHILPFVLFGWLCWAVGPQLAAQSDPAQARAAAEAARAKAIQAQRSNSASASKPNAAENGKSEAEEGDKKEGESKEESQAAKPIERPAEPATPPDPKELTAQPDESGKVQFRFNNQPWPDLINWLSDISGQPIDWLKLPGDHVNLATPKPFTIAETRDLFNRHLLSRGYTFLELDGGLAVVSVGELNPALVPSVPPSELSQLPPYQFVRTIFTLQWLKAEKLAESLKPMISPKGGRLIALTSTNRLEAMDAAINLSRIEQLLNEEEGGSARENLAREFTLRYISAEDAKSLLEQFLGVEKPSGTLQMSPQMLQQILQRSQQNRGGNNDSSGGGDGEQKISIVANPRVNAVIVNAPADRLIVAEQFIKRIDVPSQDLQSLEDIQTRMQVFRLASLDPEKLVEMLDSMNVLEPTTRLEVDKKNNALITYASVADRFVISSLIERLDGTGRRFEVLQLRRLDAQEVADSIAFLMGVNEEDDSQNSRRSYYYYRYNEEEEEADDDKFRVGANMRYNQVLLWANEVELKEVRNLLVKLGELPPEGGRQSRVRTIEASQSPEMREYLKRLKQQWEAISPNPLVLPPESETPEESDDEAEPKEKEIDAEAVPKTAAQEQPVRATSMPMMVATNTLQGPQSNETAAGDEVGEGDEPSYPTIDSADQFEQLFGRGRQPRRGGREADQPPPSIRIEFDDEGNLILLSEDTEALDRLENLMLQIAPPKRPYQVFEVEHASATWVRLNLEDYFAEEDDDSSDTDPFYRYYFGYGDDESDDSQPGGLAGKRELRFISDIDTNTIVVSGASREQLKTIKELIELWDVPEPIDQKTSRFTRLVSVKHSRATQIAETIKEAYRDLLSSNDKAFSGGRGGGGNNRGGDNNNVSRNRNGDGSELQNADNDKSGGSSTFTFKGKLSLGIDEVGNTLLVSAEGEMLLELVCDMIDQLDQAAVPQGDVQITELPGRLGGQSLHDAIRVILGGESVNITSQPQPAAATEARAPSRRRAEPEARVEAEAE